MLKSLDLCWNLLNSLSAGSRLKSNIPNKFNRYIEPFIGGVAMFFAMQPCSSIIADSNPELVNVYQCIANNVEQVLEHLSNFENTEFSFYNNS